MTTYNLDSTTLQTFLSAAVTPDTQTLINQVLQQLGTSPAGISPAPSGGASDALIGGLPAFVTDTPGATTIPGSSLFVYEGPNGTTSTVTTGGNDVLATGLQGGSIDDVGPGGDILVGGDVWGTKLTVHNGNNTLYGGHGLETLIGGAGNDVMWGGGLSSLVAGTGNDTIHGGQFSWADDTLVGGSGADILGVAQGNNVLFAGSGPNTLYGGAGNDTLWGAGNAVLQAGSGNNILHGGSNAGDHDTLIGGSGNDTMGDAGGSNYYIGGTGHDTMWLGAGNDTVNGGTGGDLVNTGAGNATVYGGTSTVVNETNAQGGIASQHVVNGVTQITFSNGQELDSKNVTINFAGGGTIHT